MKRSAMRTRVYPSSPSTSDRPRIHRADVGVDGEVDGGRAALLWSSTSVTAHVNPPFVGNPNQLQSPTSEGLIDPRACATISKCWARIHVRGLSRRSRR